jgi:hypothetical protein
MSRYSDLARVWRRPDTESQTPSPQFSPVAGRGILSQLRRRRGLVKLRLVDRLVELAFVRGQFFPWKDAEGRR